MTRRFGVLMEGGFPYFSATMEGQLIGYAYAGAYRPRPAYRFTVENSVYLQPSIHRRGVGLQLLQRLIAECEARGYRQMIAVIGDSANAGSIGVHTKCGFQMIGTHPDVGFIGVEPFVNGHAALLEKVEETGLANVRVLDFEAGPLLGWLPERSLSRVIVLYPDPWPKRRHRKRRLISPNTLSKLVKAMRPGALLWLATDTPEYAATSLAAVQAVPELDWLAEGPEDWRRPYPDWPGTRWP